MRKLALIFCVCVFAFPRTSESAAGRKPGAEAARCRKVSFTGQVLRGAEWQSSLGRDADGKAWVIRLVPVGQRPGGISGWDLAASPVDDQKYPDALLLASPPYGSLNSREIATTYGLRAQDAIAWSPRHFHLMTSSSAIEEARPLYRALLDPASNAAAREQASRRLLDLSTAPGRIASGRLEVLDAHLVSGSADAAAFAAQWASRLEGVPHTLDPDGGKPTSMGELHSLGFRISLWLPISWNPPKGVGIAPVACAE